MTFDGLDLLAVILAVLAIYLFVLYAEWKRAVRYRKFERLVHVNLIRQTGGHS